MCFCCKNKNQKVQVLQRITKIFKLIFLHIQNVPSVTEWMYYPPIFRSSMPYFFSSHCGHAIHVKTAFWSIFVDTTPGNPHIFESQWFYNHKRKLVFSFQRQLTYMLDHSFIV